MNGKRFPAPLAILTAAFAVRLAFLLWMHPVVPSTGDTPSYLAIARSLAEGKGFSLEGVFPTASRMPLYPLFLSGIISIPGAGLGAVCLIQIVLDSLTCLLAYFLAEKLLDRRHAVLTGFIAAFYVPCASSALYILSETQFCFLVMASLLALVSSGTRLRFVALSGVLMGLAALTRPNGVILAGFVLLWLAFVGRRPRRVLAFAVAVALTMAPWVARNQAVFGRFIPVYTLGGMAFYNSYAPPPQGYGFNGLEGVPEEYDRLTTEPDRSDFLIRYTFRIIRDHPLDALMSIPVRTVQYLYPFDIQWLIPSFPVSYDFFWGVLLMCACIGFAARFRWVTERLSLPLAALASLLFTSFLFFGIPRFRIPFDPLIAMIASAGVLWMWGRRRRMVWFASIAAVQIALTVAGSNPLLNDALRRLVP
jgi:4-amino-4-deoxy-L-arabinose transferase-like glycosyltransferase